WTKAGDLPVVYSASGKLEVPVPALLDLYDEVRAGGEDSPRYTLAPAMHSRREAAERMKIDKPLSHQSAGHDRARMRGLAYHQAVGGRLRRAMVEEARHVLFRWREQGLIDERYADRWEQLLARPIPEIRRALTVQSQEADDLRQNSPFAGALSEPERRRILREVA
ncbi:MAG TPA: hypothetical protein VII03_00485, partial [Solirubrobacteraceae bacterium]